jgi:hypothetical protein
MRDQVMVLAARPAKEEAIEQIETVLAKLSSPEPEASEHATCQPGTAVAVCRKLMGNPPQG